MAQTTGHAEAPSPPFTKAQSEALTEALDLEARTRMEAFLTGVERYLAFDRSAADAVIPPLDGAPRRVLWQQGQTRLIDMGGFLGDPPPVLTVPSLINRAHVLNLHPDRGFLTALSELGPHPYLLDWQEPGPEELRFDVGDYVSQRVIPALEHLTGRLGRPVWIMGYCMGGLLTLAAACLRPELVSGLVFLATPYDFHTQAVDADPRSDSSPGSLARAWAPMLTQWDQYHRAQAESEQGDTASNSAPSPPPPLPVDMVQMLFALMDPTAIARKYAAFGQMDIASDKARDMVLLEDWLNDGVPLALPAARDCLEGWYGENAIARGHWRIAETAIDAHSVRQPSLVVVPERDRIVPPASALALADALPHQETLAVPLGHVSMVAGRQARSTVVKPLSDYIIAQETRTQS